MQLYIVVVYLYDLNPGCYYKYNTTHLSIVELIDIYIVFLDISYNSANECACINENTHTHTHVDLC